MSHANRQNQIKTTQDPQSCTLQSVLSLVVKDNIVLNTRMSYLDDTFCNDILFVFL